MERPEENKKEIDLEALHSHAEHIADMYVKAAEQYLEEGDTLRDRIVSYYSSRPETEQELMTVLGKKEEGDIASYIQNVKSFTENRLRFVEQMEKLFELQDVHRRRRELAKLDRVATEEEYMLGAYTDVLEIQVRDAVLAAQKKGYATFQSGFREKTARDQFMDFYNKNINIPEKVIGDLKERGIEIRIENFDDRTTLTLHPVGSDPIRLSEWKEIWDILISELPLADTEMVPNIKVTGEHDEFRKRQDSFKK